jgi:hypothetical protein
MTRKFTAVFAVLLINGGYFAGEQNGARGE